MKGTLVLGKPMDIFFPDFFNYYYYFLLEENILQTNPALAATAEGLRDAALNFPPASAGMAAVPLHPTGVSPGFIS